MYTHVVLGTDKNAGKTTILREILSAEPPGIVTSIGINGEATDAYEGIGKPTIPLMPGQLAVTTPRWLSEAGGSVEVLEVFLPPAQNQPLALVSTRQPLELILEGPNTKSGILQLKKDLEKSGYQESTLFIDGSIDRQFLLHPEICDQASFALLWSRRLPQQNKARGFLNALNLSKAPQKMSHQLRQHKLENFKSILIQSSTGRILYSSTESPFMDPELCDAIAQNPQEILWLGGAYTRSLHQKLANFRELRIVLDHISLYQNLGVEHQSFKPSPYLMVLNTPRSLNLYLRQEEPLPGNLLPVKPVNLYRVEKAWN